MDATHTHAAQDEVETLERDHERIEAQLRTSISAAIEELLRDERRWVARRKRELERVNVSSRAMLHFAGATRPCHVRDVSAHGAGVDADVQPRVGDDVCLVLTDLAGAPALRAIVRHVTGRRVGLEFVQRGEAAKAAAEELGRRFGVKER